MVTAELLLAAVLESSLFILVEFGSDDWESNNGIVLELRLCVGIVILAKPIKG